MELVVNLFLIELIQVEYSDINWHILWKILRSFIENSSQHVSSIFIKF